eukprot:scaffold197_cov220-Prasinococcus_capsulatus_cf.AAC.2
MREGCERIGTRFRLYICCGCCGELSAIAERAQQHSSDTERAAHLAVWSYGYVSAQSCGHVRTHCSTEGQVTAARAMARPAMCANDEASRRPTLESLGMEKKMTAGSKQPFSEEVKGRATTARSRATIVVAASSPRAEVSRCVGFIEADARVPGQLVAVGGVVARRGLREGLGSSVVMRRPAVALCRRPSSTQSGCGVGRQPGWLVGQNRERAPSRGGSWTLVPRKQGLASYRPRGAQAAAVVSADIGASSAAGEGAVPR